MKILSTSATAFILTCGSDLSCAQTVTPDLKTVPEGKGWKGSIGATKLISKDGAAAVEFNKARQNV